MPHQHHAEVERRYMQMYDELKSRACAMSWGLNPADREEAQQEALCWAWEWMLSAARRGKLDKVTPFTLASYAKKMWRSGRRFAMKANVRDVMDEQARVQGKVGVVSIDEVETWAVDGTAKSRAIAKALTDSKRAQPPEVVRVEHDFGLVENGSELSDRAGQVFRMLLLDHERGCGKRIAAELGVPQPRITQIKRDEIGPVLAGIGYGVGFEAA